MNTTKNETVITGKKTTKVLLIAALGLIASITLSIAVLAVAVKIFGITNLDPVITGERVGLIVWLLEVVHAVVKAVRKSKK
ncbi:MAG: hypothetical protein J5786_01760 [Clostridiales bacterium]|nr:hypothetical protein [Clostridiales bacterium]